jgi:hypothetical protein
MHKPMLQTAMIAALLFMLVVPLAPAAPVEQVVFYVH